MKIPPPHNLIAIALAGGKRHGGLTAAFRDRAAGGQRIETRSVHVLASLYRAPRIMRRRASCRVSGMRAQIILCALGAALLCGTPVQAEAPPSGTPAEPPGKEAQAQSMAEKTTGQGTNEVTFRPRIQLSYQYRDRRDGAVLDRAVLRFDRPLLDGQLYFRVDVPYEQFDPNMSGETTSRGMGDVYVRTGVRLLNRPKFALFAWVNAFFPTGREEDLGKSKYQVGPIIAMSVPIPTINSVLSPLVEDFQSVGGIPASAK